MAIRSILLPLIGTPADESAVSTALLAARDWKAHVFALHVRADAREVGAWGVEGLTGAMIEEMMAAAEKEISDRAGAVQQMFEHVATNRGVPITEARRDTATATASFITVTGRKEDVIAQQARLADLTIVPHPETEGDTFSSDALHAVLFDSGRPVLIAPREVPTTIGTRICLAWNGTAESAASAMAALPWMQRAKAVRVLTAEGYQRRGPAGPELAAYLALHGVNAEVSTFPPINRVVGAGLLAAAQDFGCDLLSMGAYSHSRLRQLVLGGVTRHVLEHANLPVMMSR